jgi:hypothetical protein
VMVVVAAAVVIVRRSSRNYNNTSSILTEVVTLSSRIREVAGSNLGCDNGSSLVPVLPTHHTLRAENLKP